MESKKDKGTISPWFRDIIWFAILCVSAVVYNLTYIHNLSNRITIIETEFKNFKENVSSTVQDIYKNTEDILNKLPDDKP
jgi:hypothetical protein